MVDPNLRVATLLLLCTIGVAQAAALLNVTQEAVLASQQLLREVENATVYASVAQLNDKLWTLSRIPAEFEERVAAARPDVAARDLRFYVAYRDYGSQVLEAVAQKSRCVLREYGRRDENHVDDLLCVSLAEESEDTSDCRTLGGLLRKLHSVPFAQPWSSRKSSIFELLLSENECLMQSRQHRLHEFLKLISLRDAEGFVALQYTIAQIKVALDGLDYFDEYVRERLNDTVGTWVDEKDPLRKLRQSEASFASRNAETLARFRAEMGAMTRNYSTCHHNSELAFTPTHSTDKEGETYMKLAAFQRYLVNENDLSRDGSCSRECRDYAETEATHACFDQLGVCTEKTACKGKVVDCGEDTVSAMSVCPTGDSRMRYSYLEIDGRKYGDESCPNKIEAKAWLRKFNKCSYCMCVCESTDNDSDARFNLRPVLSNVTLNKVITGIRFKKVNHVVHIQIKEGKLLPHGTVNSSLAQWKPVANYTVEDPGTKAGVDYHQMSWNGGRTVYLDRLDSPKDHAMVGVRFNSVHGNLRLEIQVAPFDFETGQLSEPVTEWIYNSIALRNRDELKLDDLGFLMSQEAKLDETAGELESYEKDLQDKRKQKHSAIFASGKFVRFTTSRMEVDVGQSTIPYLDTEAVESDPAIPLSGAGVFVRNNEKVGPILALELLTFDFSSHL